MADAVSEPKASPKLEEALVLARREAEAKVPRHRFGIAYLLLAALLGAAVGLSVVFATGSGSGSGGSWSAWKPSTSGVQGRDEIGKFVGHQYALPSGRQLVGILSEPPVVQSGQQAVPVAAIALRTGLPGETANDATVQRANEAWAYVLCGFGSRCAIAEGQASVTRYDLLRREALELAAYTFKYNGDVQSVLTYMPPGKALNAGGSPTTSMIFLRRSDIKPVLDSPLSEALPPPKTHLTPGQMSPRELGVVRRFTDAHIYNYEFQALQDGSAAIVLTPVKA
jgi:hypothetical protein